MSYDDWKELNPDIQADIIITAMVLTPSVEWSELMVDHIEHLLPAFNSVVDFARMCQTHGIKNGGELIKHGFDNVVTLVGLVVPDLAEFSTPAKKGDDDGLRN